MHFFPARLVIGFFFRNDRIVTFSLLVTIAGTFVGIFVGVPGLVYSNFSAVKTALFTR